MPIDRLTGVSWRTEEELKKARDDKCVSDLELFSYNYARTAVLFWDAEACYADGVINGMYLALIPRLFADKDGAKKAREDLGFLADLLDTKTASEEQQMKNPPNN